MVYYLIKDKTTLIQYPIGNEERETYTVLNTVTSIEEEAFAENTKITKLGIPTKVINIGENAFQDCENLKKFTVKLVQQQKNMLKRITSITKLENIKVLK